MQAKNDALVRSLRSLPARGMTRSQFFATTFGTLAAAALGRPLQAQRGAVNDASLGASGEPAAWTRFRGPNGTGVVPGGGYPNIGPSTLAWKRALPMGKSSPVLTNKYIFLTAHRDTTPLVICLDKRTGEPLWERAVQTQRRESRHPTNALSAPTQVTDGENVYSFFADFGLISHDSSGNRRWEAPIPPTTTLYGVATSPIVVGNDVVLQIDGYDNAYIAAFDRATGRQRWRTARPPEGQSYSTPVVRRAHDRVVEIVTLAPHQIIAYDARTGAERWVAPAPSGRVVGSLAVHGDVLFSTTGFAAVANPSFDPYLKLYDKDGNGRLSLDELGTDAVSAIAAIAARYRGDKDGVLTADEFVEIFGNAEGGQPTTTATNIGRIVDGKVVPRMQWQLPRGVPIVSTPLVHEGLLYLVANGGILTVVEPNTGAVVKQGRLEGAIDAYYSSPVGANDKIFIVSEVGNAVTLRAGRDWQVLSVSDLNDPCYATPALEDGRIYLRTNGALSCFGGR